MALPPGMSVRAINHANITPMMIAGTRRATERRKLIQSALTVVGSLNARSQLSKPYTAARPGCAKLKLPVSRNSNGSPVSTVKSKSMEHSATRIGRRRNLGRGRSMVEAGMLIKSSALMNRHGARIEAHSDFGADWVAVSLGRGQNENCARPAHIVLEAVAEIIHLL